MRYLTPLFLCPSWLALALRLDLTGRSLASLKTIDNNVLAASEGAHSDAVSLVLLQQSMRCLPC
jgi:hypothetical protein